MTELVYLDSQEDYTNAQAAIRGHFPTATFEDASDFIHEYRFSVDIDCERDAFWLFALQEGFALCCIGFQLLIREDFDRAKRLVEQVKNAAPA